MSELTEAQYMIMKTALRQANTRARLEVLPRLRQQTIGGLGNEWSPFRADSNRRSAYGFKLTPQADKLTLEIMQDETLYALMEEIAVDSVESAVMLHQPTFVSSLLNDLFSESPTYKVKTEIL